MRLSEAIRLGAMLGPQAKGDLFVGDGTCAIGSAMRAAGMHKRDAWVDDCFRRFPIMEREVLDPVTERQRKMLNIVWWLNDCEDWTRERIADWVESIERQHGLIPESQPEAVAVIA